jgi:hypothetical protein
MIGMCQGSTPATTDCRTFVPPVLKSYYRPPPAGMRDAPNDDERLSIAWGAPSLNFADSYRYDQFEGAVAQEAEKEIKKEGYQAPKVFRKTPGSQEMGSCSLDGSAGGCGGSIDSGRKDGIYSIDNTSNLLQILDPRFNMREASKHMILLEDHLFQPGRRCKDCCCKHLLTIEAFLEEAITLDKNYENYDVIILILKDFKNFSKDLCAKIQTGNLSDKECCQLAQNLRIIRKPLCQKYATFV